MLANADDNMTDNTRTHNTKEKQALIPKSWLIISH